MTIYWDMTGISEWMNEQVSGYKANIKTEHYTSREQLENDILKGII